MVDIPVSRTPKIYLYSTHDSTMVALLESTGLFNWQWPPFAADLRFELYEDDDKQHWVRVLYCGEVRYFFVCSVNKLYICVVCLA